MIRWNPNTKRPKNYETLFVKSGMCMYVRTGQDYNVAKYEELPLGNHTSWLRVGEQDFNFDDCEEWIYLDDILNMISEGE